MNYKAITAVADKLNYIEKCRIVLQNQCRSLSESEFRALPATASLQVGVDILVAAEKETVKELEAITKKHPLWIDFFASVRGCGLKSAGRLLGLLDNPLCYINQDDEVVERTVGSLWHYCGYAHGHDKHKSGEQGTFKPRARMHLYVIAECFIRAGGYYADIYYERKAATAGKGHTETCMNTIKPVNGKPMGSNGCGTQAHPEWGAVGAPWRDGHRHKDAIRIMMKTFLKDLYIAADELERGEELPLAA